jgi:RNA polymerase sigma-70 factor (ECF subfamily)
MPLQRIAYVLDAPALLPPLDPLADMLGGLRPRRPWSAPEVGADAGQPVEAASDEDCMLRYQRGDAQAFGQLYRRYRQRLHRYVLRLAPRPAEAEEVFQDVWTAVIQGRGRYRSSNRFAAWLFAIAHRRAADRWRNLGRHAPDELLRADADGQDLLAGLADSSQALPECRLDNDALAAALLEAIGKLPPLQREAFLLKSEGELSLDEIAAVTGVPRETAKSRLRYASQRLRLALQDWR